jgi:UDP-N-acetylglucosamine 1-carboxyvinyltransferase
MSRIGRKPITVPAGVEVKVDGANVVTLPYPYFPTDLHPQFAALLCFTRGGGVIKEKIFPSRFAYAYELSKMGAKIRREDNVAYIFPSQMHGADIDATDLRAGASLICAALGANGKSTIKNVNYIVRGYEDIVSKIALIGGKINLIKGD